MPQLLTQIIALGLKLTDAFEEFRVIALHGHWLGLSGCVGKAPDRLFCVFAIDVDRDRRMSNSTI
jgi:hypothetical protein